MIVIDQLRIDRLNICPIFQNLKQKGIFFSEMITYAPYTIASMHATFSGMYGKNNGVNAYYKALNFDKENCFTLAQYLKENNYHTIADTFSKILIPNQGFDELLIHDENRVNLTARHLELIKRVTRNKRKFFLFLHYGNIHTEMVKNVANKISDFDENYFKNIDRNSRYYNQLVKHAGNYLDQVFNEINDLGLLSNTMLILFTDHGCSVGEKLGEKVYGVFTYDYSIKVFAYFIYSKLLPQNIQINELVRTIDILPTILDILNISPKKNFKNIQGNSLLPLISGDKKDDQIAFVETGGLGGPNPSTHEPNVKCIRTKEWKLIYNTTTKKKELYRLVEDKDESNNLIGQYPEIEKYLWRKMITNW